MKIKLFSICVVYFTILCSSCSKWINITPTDKLTEDMLYSDRAGFLKALNGVYVELANHELYGANLSSSIIDVMGQYYLKPSNTQSYYYYATYAYNQEVVKLGFENIWQKAYELLTNCNVIIEKCDEQNGVLTDSYFNIIKGEALAIRAMIHFDMLRLFGPIWSDENKSKVTIPYSSSGKIEISPLLTADDVMKNITDDFTSALQLLKKSDPILTEGVRNFSNPDGSNDLYFRQYRLNYYAVKALLARAHLWKGDKKTALQYSKEILEEVQNPSKPIFPFVTGAAATNATAPDRVFSSEIIFSLYQINRGDLYRDLFSADLEQKFRLSFNNGGTDKSRVNELYDDENDYRRRIWEDVSVLGGAILTNQKYKDYSESASKHMIPLIRLSEVLLMAAECSDDLQESIKYLNTLRTHRNCISLFPANASELNNIIAKEFRKEVIGEGQMFFYYKRNAMTFIPSHLTLTGEQHMLLQNYVVPLPDSEISQRRNR